MIWAACDLMYTWFLQFWATDYYDSKNYWLFILITLAITFVGSFCFIFKSFIIFVGSVRVSKLLFFKMSFTLMHASITNFFDRIPIGRILNRFLRDMNEIDNTLGYSVSYFLTLGFIACVDLVASVVASSPIMIIFIGIYLFLCLRVQQYYMNTSREITRLRSISASPTIQSFSEGMQGGPFIRAFGKIDHSVNLYAQALEIFQINCLTKDALMRWFSVRLSLLSILVLLPSIALNIFVVKSGAGLFALLMRYMLTLVGDVADFLDNMSNTENQLVSFERCSYFVDIEPESGYKNLEKIELGLLRNNLSLQRETEWPKLGFIQVKDLKVRYREGLKHVLKGITLEIPHATKLGIVGRTGAGKTTFLSCLYRHIDSYEGQVLIDGVELRNLDLKELRSSISIIPQEPYLFSDTLRNNIDPLRQRTENEIVKTLAEVGLWNKFKMGLGLETKIEKGGSNLSQGEKQLVCFCRALLFQKKIILMDEATANVDPESEAAIQRLIREKFFDCTLVMIAHRLNTVLQCDKILVLGEGQVIEYDDISRLKEDPNSHFYQMLSKQEEIESSLK